MTKSQLKVGDLPHPFHTTIVNLDSLEENGWLEEEESFLNLHCLVLVGDHVRIVAGCEKGRFGIVITVDSGKHILTFVENDSV